jgi:Putative zinc-finger
MMNMTCQNCQSELEDFLYGELKPSRASQVRAHLSACSVCSAARDELEREHEIFTQYYEQSALEPSPAMWEVIRTRIHAEHPPQKQENRPGGEWLRGGALSWLTRPAVIRQTAFAFLIILLTATATTIILRRGEEKVSSPNTVIVDSKVSPSPTASGDPGGVAPKPAPPAQNFANSISPRPATPRLKPLTDEEKLARQIVRTEREYQNAIRLLDLAIARRKGEFDPAVIKQYEASLALIDNSIAASRLALRTHPTDIAARQFLFAAYARKVELMQDIAMR